MKKDPHPSSPFATTDLTVAVALRGLGVPWAKDEKGLPCPCFNFYTRGKLRDIEDDLKKVGAPTLGLAGKSPEDAVRTAFRAGIPGHVEYTFERTPGLYEIMKGWDQQSDLIANADKGPADGETVTGELDISPELAGRIACQLAKTRRDFVGTKNSPPIWRRVLPIFADVDATTRQINRKNPREGFTTEGSFHGRSVAV